MTLPVPVTALYGAISALLNVALAINVSRARGKHKISVGDGGDAEMIRAIRTHANNAEYVPLSLLLLLILELSGGPNLWLHIFGGVIFTARLLHAAGMQSARGGPLRIVGILLTWASIVALACFDLYYRCGCGG